MKKLTLLLACAFLMGCEYTVPLVNSPKININRAAVGLWQRTNDAGRVDSLLILPLNGREYLVSFPAGTKDAMFARACLWQCAGLTLAQLNWIGNARAKLPEDKRTFQFMSYKIEGDSIRIRQLSTEIIKKDIKSPDELARAIMDNKDNPNLFREEMVFIKIKN